MTTHPELPPAILPLLQNQHPCFGQCSKADPACGECVVSTLCLRQRDRKMVDFAANWERYSRLGAANETITLPSPTVCNHCGQLMRPEDGKVLYVAKRGTFHMTCVDEAFPLDS